MLKLRKVALTGGLSCGKSSVCRILKEFGAYIISADEIVHQLLSSDANLGKKIIDLLGPSVWVNQRLDRSRIAHIVFHDLKLLEALEKLVHPVVYRELNKAYQEQSNRSQPPSLFVAEIPLLFESDGQRDYDKTVVVIANSEICYKRFKEATGQDQVEFNQRMARQIPLLDKALRADYIIMNNGSLSDLQHLVKELYQKLLEG